GVTHKIDPDIDLERDYVQKTLVGTGLVSQYTLFLPENPMREARTATGGSFHSNGQVLILKLASASNSDPSHAPVPSPPSADSAVSRHAASRNEREKSPDHPLRLHPASDGDDIRFHDQPCRASRVGRLR